VRCWAVSRTCASTVGPRHTVFEGECGGKRTALVVAGPGRAAARRGAELLLAGHRPRWVVSAGFAGALDPALARDDLVLATEIVDLDGGHFAIDLSVPEAAQGQRISAGRLVTVDAIVRTAAEKAALRARFGADLVDMETSAVAALCGGRGIPVPLGPRRQRRGEHRPAPGGPLGPGPHGQLSPRRGAGGDVAAPVELQGPVGAARARPLGRRSAGGHHAGILARLP
jgi:hypothetical protein